MNIKEIRNTTGLSQHSFSKMFNIPISTLQKWEQGESSPTPYIIKLIANQLPIDNDNMCKIEDNIFSFIKSTVTIKFINYFIIGFKQISHI